MFVYVSTTADRCVYKGIQWPTSPTLVYPTTFQRTPQCSGETLVSSSLSIFLVSIYLSVCLSLYLSICLSAYPSVAWSLISPVGWKEYVLYKYISRHQTSYHRLMKHNNRRASRILLNPSLWANRREERYLISDSNVYFYFLYFFSGDVMVVFLNPWYLKTYLKSYIFFTINSLLMKTCCSY